MTDAVRSDSPATILQGRDCQAELELESVLRVKIAATVAAHDFKLAVDGFDEIGGGEGFPHVLGIF